MKASNQLSPAAINFVSEVQHLPSARDADYLALLLEHVHATLRCCMGQPEVLEQYVPLIEKIAFGFDGPGVIESLKLSDAQLKDFNDAYCIWETALECAFTEAVRSGTAVDISRYALNERFHRLLRREVSMLTGPLHGKRVLFIGSGPVPISAIWMNRLLRVKIDCLDINEDAVRLSRQLVAELGLAGQIHPMQGTGEHLDVSGYDVILIALLAKPKRLILENIYRAAPDDCQIICRTSYGLRQILYEPTPFDGELLQHFSREDERVVIGSCDDTISSVLLRKVG